MKKLFFALLALPMMAMLSSCHDDDDMPQVNLNVTYNSPVVDGQVYVVKPNEFKVEEVTVTPERAGHKATNGPVSYFMGNIPLGTNPVSPFGITIPTEDLDAGKYVLNMTFPVWEEGCSPMTAYSSIVINVVESEDDIPEAAAPAVSQDLRFSLQ